MGRWGSTKSNYIFFVVLCPGTPEGSTGSGSGFKASQKTGQRLKVSSDRLGEAGNRTCDPWFKRHRFIPYTTAASTWVVGVSPNLNTWVVGIYSFAKLKKNGLHLSLKIKTVTTNSM